MALEHLLHHDLSLIMIGIALMAVVTLTIIPMIYRYFKMFRYFQAFPGEPSFSIFTGNLHMIPKTPEERIEYGRSKMTTVNPRFFRFWIGPLRPSVTVFHPETAKLVYKSSAPKSRGFGQIYEFAVPWIGEGLISSNGSRWARSRRLLTPAFHFDILKNYMNIYNEAADVLFEKLNKFAESGESFDMCPLLTLCTLEIILKCAMGYDADIQRKGHHPYATATRELIEDWHTRGRTPWMWPDFIFKLSPTGRNFYKNCNFVHKVAEEVIEKRRQSLEKGGRSQSRHMDFLDILLTARDEDGNPMTPLEIRSEVDTFMFAGHDTTASAAPWILYTLAKHPEYQRQVQAEVDAILDGRESDRIEWSDLSKFEVLSRCIKEAMRLYPPVPFIQRVLNEDLIIEGRRVPANTLVSIAIIHLHKNPQVWENPDEFQPDRFKPENIKQRDSFAFTPFSAGSRNCIGQNFALNEEKVLVARVLRRYDLELAPDGPPMERVARAILKSSNGLWFKLKLRKH